MDFNLAAIGQASSSSNVSVEYEVFGQVQGCYFTKYLKELCEQRNVGGWVKNSRAGTIMGKLQGPRGTVEEVIHWLKNTGSPGSKIDRVDLRNWELITRPEFRSFSLPFLDFLVCINIFNKSK